MYQKSNRLASASRFQTFWLSASLVLTKEGLASGSNLYNSTAPASNCKHKWFIVKSAWDNKIR